MVANNDFGQMFTQKSNSSNITKAAEKKPVAAPVSAPQVAKPAAQVKNVPDAAAVVAANEAALEANDKKEQKKRAQRN